MMLLRECPRTFAMAAFRARNRSYAFCIFVVTVADS